MNGALGAGLSTGQCLPSKQGEVAHEISTLANCVEACEKALSVHIEKLQSILNTRQPAEVAQCEKEEEPEVCALAQVIRELRNRLDSVSNGIQKTTAQIEI